MEKGPRKCDPFPSFHARCTGEWSSASAGDEHPSRQRHDGVDVEVVGREVVIAQLAVRGRVFLPVGARELDFADVQPEPFCQRLAELGDRLGRVHDVGLELEPQHHAALGVGQDAVVVGRVAEALGLERHHREATRLHAFCGQRCVDEGVLVAHDLVVRAVDVEEEPTVVGAIGPRDVAPGGAG